MPTLTVDLLQLLPETDFAALVDLLVAQDTRFKQSDPRLRPPRLPAEISDSLEAYLGLEVFLVRGEAGEIQAFGIPDIWEIPPGSEMLGFLRPETGVARFLATVDFDGSATLIPDMLLDALLDWWVEHEAGGVSIDWPSIDTRTGNRLVERGFARDITGAMRPLGSLPDRPSTDGITIRRAKPGDEKALVALHLEELRFHETHTPHVRVVPGTEPAFRERLDRVWRNESVEDGASLIMVAVRAGKVVGFTENWISSMRGSWLPGGRYGYLNSVGVSAEHRGHGIGRLLALETLKALAGYPIDAYTLYFAYANPLSSRFWPRMGFRPVVDTYKRHF